MRNLEAYPTVDAFYDAVPDARRSGESDFGVWWRDDQRGTWRVSYVHDTGHVYALRARRHGNEVKILRAGGETLGTVDPAPPRGEDGPCVVMGRLAPVPEDREWDEPVPADAPLKGWEDRCGREGSLLWAWRRLAGARRQEARP